MNRRDFSALLPMLMAAPALVSVAEAQSGPQSAAAPASLPKLASGQYVWGEAFGAQRPARTSHRFLMGMLPDNIRVESHVTFLAPGAPAEPIEHHKHSEIWFIREGSVALMSAGVTRTLKAGDMGLVIAGDDHSITNASKTEPASYFVLAVGPPE
ncbi:MAG: cupin domain-containing protein [Terracidiphilus sp.]|jgi:mannose-6-phosphate isomerase-like protein (cupin superfamily)